MNGQRSLFDNDGRSTQRPTPPPKPPAAAKEPPASDPLILVRADFFNTLKAGEATTCPVCRRYAKYELRPLNKTMACSLLWIASRYEITGEWVDVQSTAPAWVLRTKQHTTLEKWGLLERKPNEKYPDKKHSGIWRPTALGLEFVMGCATVPRKVLLWDDARIGESPDRITIHDALESPGFQYSKILQSPNTEITDILEKKKTRKEEP